MPTASHHLAVFLALALPALSVGGCSSINEKLTPTVVDAIPSWAGGLPRDVPPRRGTPEYDAYMQERERKRLEPAVAADGSKPGSPAATSSTAPSASASSAMALDPVH
jgi:hypothetical protein